MFVVKGDVVFSADKAPNERKNWSDRMQRAFAFVTVENSLCFGVIGGVRSAESVMI